MYVENWRYILKFALHLSSKNPWLALRSEALHGSTAISTFISSVSKELVSAITWTEHNPFWKTLVHHILHFGGPWCSQAKTAWCSALALLGRLIPHPALALILLALLMQMILHSSWFERLLDCLRVSLKPNPYSRVKQGNSWCLSYELWTICTHSSHWQVHVLPGKVFGKLEILETCMS